MSMEHQDAAPLDGNAKGGLLTELFALDLTAAEITCGGCGAVAPTAVEASSPTVAEMMEARYGESCPRSVPSMPGPATTYAIAMSAGTSARNA